MVAIVFLSTGRFVVDRNDIFELLSGDGNTLTGAEITKA
jgi:hypothetical protein